MSFRIYYFHIRSSVDEIVSTVAELYGFQGYKTDFVMIV